MRWRLSVSSYMLSPKIFGDVDDIFLREMFSPAKQRYVSDVLLKQRGLSTDSPIRKIHNDSHYIYT